MQLLVDRIESPIGTIVLITNGDRLCALDFADYERRMLGLLSKRYQSFELVSHINPHGFSSKIRAYLAGDYAGVRDIAIDAGGTDFQQLVWQELRQIPIGKTITYGELATRVGKPTAARAVGMAWQTPSIRSRSSCLVIASLVRSLNLLVMRVVWLANSGCWRMRVSHYNCRLRSVDIRSSSLDKQKRDRVD
jgi:methylated-DNA-[protein]-cysteine S-methyltransferase